MVGYWLLAGKRDPLSDLTYDEDGDFDETSIVKIMDAHFQMGKVPEIRQKFNQERLIHLKKNNLEQYISCVIKNDSLLVRELDKNLE